jgi:hypothetical protein
VKRTLFLILLTLPAMAGDPSPIEDSNFLPESGWNRADGVLQYTSFFLRDATAHELTQEWALRLRSGQAASPKHQLSYTVPFYSDGKTGFGDATLNYRYQLFGKAASKFAVAPRLSLVLPTRSPHFGLRSSGVQVNVPISASLGERLTTHTNAGATWFRERGEKEVNLAQSIAFALTPRIALSLDAAYTRCEDASHLFVVRPGVQFTLEGPGGLQIAPGIALPLGTEQGGVLVFVSLEHPVSR